MNSIEQVADRIIALRANLLDESRLIVGIAGAPGSGKSTLAGNLLQLLDQRLADQNESAVVVPMDGFHLDNEVLDARGLRAVKGSPPTFDASGFVSVLQRITRKLEESVYVPVFDRTADLARNAAQEVCARHSIALVEGNYLLLNQPVWRQIKPLLDFSVMLDVPIGILEARLIQRWLDHGLSAEDAQARALSNDIPNAKLVLQESIAADLNYKSVQ